MGGRMTIGFALLAMGFIAVCLVMIVLGWTLDAVWVAGRGVGASVDAGTGTRGRISREGDRPSVPRG
jgi:hypothetical protein